MKKMSVAFKRLLFVIVIIILAVWLSAYGRQGVSFVDKISGELDRALSKTETILDYAEDGPVVYALVKRSGGLGEKIFFMVFNRTEDGEWVRGYENDFTSRKPWKLEAADIDGDGQKEILTAVRKPTTFDPTEKNRLFVFNYDGTVLYKQWTGSRIAGDWNDFYAGDLVSVPGDELIFVQQTEDQKEKISAYYWFDFGFFLLASSDGFEDIRNVSISGENRIRIVCQEGKKSETVTMMLQDGKIIRTAE